jgi:hypothetical protein
MFDNSPRFALSSADSESAPATRKKTPLITFEDEPRKPTYMPYIMLDPKWYQNTTEDERLQQGTLSPSPVAVAGSLVH